MSFTFKELIDEVVPEIVYHQLNNKPVVQYHCGGLMFAGDETYYDPGWYIFIEGVGTFPVEVNISTGDGYIEIF